MDHTYKLTHFAPEGGCSAKLPPGELKKIIRDVLADESVDERLLSGNINNEDAAVYRVSGTTCMVSTVDFFPPMVDDPFIFGQVAAANALSDIYAMGGKPVLALNLLMTSCEVDDEVLSLILKGALDKVNEAGAVIAGGHSITDKGLKFGLCVNGLIDENHIWKNHGAKEGDVLVLTKPLGAGIYSVASKAGMLDEEDEDEWTKNMTRLNKNASLLAEKYDVHACTDITGFGLLVHTMEMAAGSKAHVRIYSDKVPMLKKARESAMLGLIPMGTYSNRAQAEKDGVVISDSVALDVADVLYNPETSGGLLLAMPKEDARQFLEDMIATNEDAFVIGDVLKSSLSKELVEVW